MQNIPEPPPEPIVIDQEDMARLAAWITFFTNLSPRITLIQPRDNEFEGLLPRAERLLRAEMLNLHYTLIDWPSAGELAFVLSIDSSPPGGLVGQEKLEDVYFFCLGNVAFGLKYFEWDGDAEEGNWAESFSVRGHYSPTALSWEHVCSIIVGKVRGYEIRIPPLPPK